MNYTKKPVTVEAYQITRELLAGILFDKKPYPDGLSMTSCSKHDGDRIVHHWFGEVITIHNQKTDVVLGDWIITEPDGIHHYPCKPDIFEQTYTITAPKQHISKLYENVEVCKVIAEKFGFTLINAEYIKKSYCTMVEMCNEEGYTRTLFIHDDGGLEYDEDNTIPKALQIATLILSLYRLEE